MSIFYLFPNLRLNREARTIHIMLYMHCHAHHSTHHGLCADCTELLAYALHRLKKCPYQKNKPTCAKCPIHCYKPEMRTRIARIMRYSGPRLLLRHPILAIAHLLDGLRKPPAKTAR